MRLRLALAFVAAVLLVPLAVFAQEAPAAPASGGINVALIITILTGVAAVLGTVMGWFPKGWKTYASIALAAISAGIPALTELAKTHPQASLVGVVLALVGALIGRFKAEPKG